MQRTKKSTLKIFLIEDHHDHIDYLPIFTINLYLAVFVIAMKVMIAFATENLNLKMEIKMVKKYHLEKKLRMLFFVLYES